MSNPKHTKNEGFFIHIYQKFKDNTLISAISTKMSVMLNMVLNFELLIFQVGAHDEKDSSELAFVLDLGTLST